MPRVYAGFFLRHGWYVQFLEENLKTPLRKKLTFADPAKIIELARRGGALKESETRAHLDYVIQKGRGGIYLNLSEAQYKKLL
jgi:hypothetical protein